MNIERIETSKVVTIWTKEIVQNPHLRYEELLELVKSVVKEHGLIKGDVLQIVGICTCGCFRGKEEITENFSFEAGGVEIRWFRHPESSW